MATRTGSAVWEGTLKQGKGIMKLGSGAFEGPYSFSSRFEEAKGTNPEELIGAAEAGCYSMALSANLEKAGHPAKRISTTATVKLEMVGGGPKITTIDLKTEADVPGIDETKFKEQAELTKKACLVSVALAGTLKTTGMLYVVIVGALIFAVFMSFTGLAQQIASLMHVFQGRPATAVAAIAVLLLLLGSVLASGESAAAELSRRRREAGRVFVEGMGSV